MRDAARAGASRVGKQSSTADGNAGAATHTFREPAHDCRHCRQVLPGALSAADAAAFYGVSRSLWWKLHATGGVPEPIRLGRRVLWLRSDLEHWERSGTPSRTRWFSARGEVRR